MAETLPALIDPLTPEGCDLRAYEFMPLSVSRLRDADILSEVSPEGFRAAVLLWCASWHQVPAASLPDDDKLLARYAGYGHMVPAFKAIRDEALYGFIKCADGRLYHPTVAEKANESWAKRVVFMARSEAANAAKEALKATAKGTLAPKNPTLKVADLDLEGDLSEVKGIEGKRKKDSVPSGESAAPPKASPKRGTCLAEDWTPTSEQHQWAVETGLTAKEATDEADRFRDYWCAVAGAKGRHVSWDGTWRNWVRRACDDRRGKVARMAAKPRVANGRDGGNASFADLFLQRHGQGQE